jgi:glycosyltransferase involved in cell wall biosynthesis
VVIPSFNYGHFVTEAVDSALAQTYADREVLVVDDGSTDDTRQRLAPYGDRIRYLYQENRGLSAARNAGVRAARGEYVALLDADDVWHPQKLELQMAYLAAHPEVGLLGAERTKERPARWPALGRAAGLAARTITLEQLVVCSRFGPSSVVIARRCFEAIGYFDPALRSVEDRHLWLRIAARFAVRKLESVLWWYRVHEGSMCCQARRMEEYEAKVLQDLLANTHELRGRPLLRRRALGRAAFSAAVRYTGAGHHGLALGRLLRSWLQWPFPFRRTEVVRRLIRPRALAVILLRLLRLRRSPGWPRGTMNPGRQAAGVPGSGPVGRADAQP